MQLTEGLYKGNNPPVFAYAKTSPFAQGGLSLLSLPCGAAPQEMPGWCRNCVAAEGLKKVRISLQFSQKGQHTVCYSLGKQLRLVCHE